MDSTDAATRVAAAGERWVTMPTDVLQAALEGLDDSTELWDAVADELAEREHSAEVQINNGGILP